ncbi:hypothetical protein DZS_11900 [Dickeya ananatis]
MFCRWTVLEQWVDRYPLLMLILRRLLAGVAMVAVVSVLIFAGIQLLPGNAATAILGQTATPEAVRALNAQLGLDQPAVSRYLSWLWGMIGGDFGQSFTSRQAIAPVLAWRLENTLFLAGCTAVVAVPLALLIGFLSVRYQGSWLDRLLNLLARVAVALPEFFLRLPVDPDFFHQPVLAAEQQQRERSYATWGTSDSHRATLPDAGAGGTGPYEQYDPCGADRCAKRRLCRHGLAERDVAFGYPAAPRAAQRLGANHQCDCP